MCRKLLTRKFLRDNPYLELSSQRFVYTLLCHEGFEALANETLQQHMTLSAARKSKIDSEKEMLAALSEPNEIFSLLRKDIDGFNRAFLIEKALEYEDDIFPKLIDRFIRSDHDTLIDNAVRFLAACKTDCSEVLFVRYDEIRSPYVKSLVCILLGFKAQESIIPWMMDQFQKLKKHYPDEHYDQGPLMALNELHHRFYA
jgi:hypothetical protein